ncbi:hypothetical protein [Rhodococcus sp. IEGM 1379]|uniref:hypothetical protein n=1 Tax=Rhodococcus sp. IEGM 1379 TaxID=3047086 RepID=UPI0024B80F8F|nr:hypothetical protein [Rhodococcus sp. IEGM 1379]MDI9918184.1 hypothetical protein [Rhodococcus sp. IEGM 1379]
MAATSPAGATVTWPTPIVPTALTFGPCTPNSGTILSVGTHTVTCTLGSTANTSTGRGTFTVTVTAAPTIPAAPATGSLGSLGSAFGS